MQVVEHLVLKTNKGGLTSKYMTKYHDDLGYDLQKALEVLEREGWEAVTCCLNSGGRMEVILKRTPR